MGFFGREQKKVRKVNRVGQPEHNLFASNPEEGYAKAGRYAKAAGGGQSDDIQIAQKRIHLDRQLPK